MNNIVKSPDSRRLSCPICRSTFVEIFPAGECGTCGQLVCGHCIHHDIPGREDSICQECMFQLTPAGRLSKMTVDDLIQILEDPVSDESALAAGILSKMPDPSTVAALCRALTSTRLDVRRESAAALGKLKNDAAIPHLLKALDDSSPVVQSRAAASLGQLQASDAVLLLKALVDNPSRQVAGHAVQALGKLMGKGADRFFNTLALEHPSDFIKCEALAILFDLNRDLAMSTALKSLASNDKKVVLFACKLLDRFNDIRAVPALQQLIEKQPAASIRITAAAVLKKILAPAQDAPDP